MKILQDENNPRFFIYAEKLFSRLSDPERAFEYVSKELFCRQWPIIKEIIKRDVWAKGRIDFWETVYKKLLNSRI